MKNIKEAYSNQLNIFLGLNILVVYGFVFGTINIESLYEKELYKTGVVVVLPIIAFVLNGLMPNAVKEFLVFWRVKESLPGNRAFSKYAKNDERIDFEVLEQKHTLLKEDSFNENKLWYKIYQKHQESPSVWDAQKSYLFSRDMTALSVYFLVASLILALFYDDKVSGLIGAFIVEYLVLMATCRVYAVKFVRNVLATESGR